jgi:hypothetical protein
MSGHLPCDCCTAIACTGDHSARCVPCCRVPVERDPWDLVREWQDRARRAESRAQWATTRLDLYKLRARAAEAALVSIREAVARFERGDR